VGVLERRDRAQLSPRGNGHDRPASTFLADGFAAEATHLGLAVVVSREATDALGGDYRGLANAVLQSGADVVYWAASWTTRAEVYGKHCATHSAQASR